MYQAIIEKLDSRNVIMISADGQRQQDVTKPMRHDEDANTLDSFKLRIPTWLFMQRQLLGVLIPFNCKHQ